jgi:hypothetical protein
VRRQLAHHRDHAAAREVDERLHDLIA